MRTAETKLDMGLTLYCRQEISPKWARAVKRHQRHLMARLLHPTPPREVPPESLPWHPDDLIRRKGSGRGYTSIYRGVTLSPPRMQKAASWIARRPGSNTKSTRALGYWPTELDAAWAVVLDANPNAIRTPTQEAESVSSDPQA